MKKVYLLVLISWVLVTCNDDKDPGPDLSAVITVTLEDDQGATIYPETIYVVVSDTSGTVHDWSIAGNGSPAQLSYPKDPKLAVLTFIRKTLSPQPDYIGTGVVSVAEIPAGNYTMTLPPLTPFPEDPDEFFDLTIAEGGSYSNLIVYPKPDSYVSYTSEGADFQYRLGLFNKNSTHDLFLSAIVNGNTIRHKYIEGIAGGESLTITPEDFNDFTLTPSHVLDYPEHANMNLSTGFLFGFRESRSYGSEILDNGSWDNSQTPAFVYPDIPNLYDSYLTLMYSWDNNYSYGTVVRGPEPASSFSNMNTSISSHEATTKHISADLSGDGEVFSASGDYSDGSSQLYLTFLTPASSKVRISLPQFPQDLLDEVPNLIDAKEKSFDYVSVDDYNMSYIELFKSRLIGSFTVWPDYSRSVAIGVGPNNGRMLNSPAAMLKRMNIQHPTKIK